MMEMRISKYRHVYCNAPRQDQLYQEIRLATAIGDQNYIKANPKYFAVSFGRCGGQLLIHPHDKPGRVPAVVPTLCGHAGDVLDFDFNPFDDEMILSSSVDCTLKLWKFPEGGLTENISTPVVSLEGHQKKVTFCEFNPVANLIAASVSADHDLKIWDVENAKVLNSFHTEDLSQDLHWNYDGSLTLISCKDKKYRLFDPRTNTSLASQVFHCHDGTKGSKFTWLSEENFITTGFSKTSQREYKLWDLRSLDAPIENSAIDQASGVIMPFYDTDAHLLYFAGKGDGNIRVFEVDGTKLYPTANTQYSSTVSAKGMCMMPKRGVDVMKCEIDRLYKVTSSGNIEPLHFIIPRRCEGYQEDLYTDCYGGKPALTSEQWISGQNAKPITVTMSPYKEKQYSSVVLEQPESNMVVEEEPMKEEPIKEEPVKEEPVKEEPVKEEPVKEEPIKEDIPTESTIEHISSSVPAENVPVMTSVDTEEAEQSVACIVEHINEEIEEHVMEETLSTDLPPLSPVETPEDIDMNNEHHEKEEEETIPLPEESHDKENKLTAILQEIEEIKTRLTSLEQEVQEILHQ